MASVVCTNFRAQARNPPRACFEICEIAVTIYLATTKSRKLSIGTLSLSKHEESMSKINLRISDARKRLADHLYNQRVIELDGDYSHADINEITFYMMREREKRQYIEIYAEWMKLKVRARKETYLDAFKDEDVIPNEADLSEMIFALQEVVDEFTKSLPQELSQVLEQIGRMHAIEDARRDIEIFAQKMTIKQIPNQSNNTTNIYGPNYGPLQQGGQGNIQNLNMNAEFEAKINELFALVENSTLTSVQKLKAVNDIRTVRELSRLETTSEVQEEASTRLDGVTSVLSLSADLLSVGMPIIQISGRSLSFRVLALLLKKRW